VNGRAAARSGEWAQHFSNASCLYHATMSVSVLHELWRGIYLFIFHNNNGTVSLLKCRLHLCRAHCNRKLTTSRTTTSRAASVAVRHRTCAHAQPARTCSSASSTADNVATRSTEVTRPLRPDYTLFHRRTRASYVYNECLAWYNIVLTPRVHSSVKFVGLLLGTHAMVE